MSALRFVSLVVLAFWVGGLAALGGLAAPTLVAILGSATLLIVWGVRAALGPRPRWLALRVWVVLAMLGVSIAAGAIQGLSTALKLACIAGGLVLIWCETRDT